LPSLQHLVAGVGNVTDLCPQAKRHQLGFQTPTGGRRGISGQQLIIEVRLLIELKTSVYKCFGCNEVHLTGNMVYVLCVYSTVKWLFY